MRSMILLACLVLLSGCTSKSVGPVVKDSNGDSFTKVQFTTEYEVSCKGSCLERR